jgi:glycosyltransferase involved in cell wall biosynthesis
MFGRWARRHLARSRWDVIHCWSGVSEEILEAFRSRDGLTLLMRGSCHIAVQRRLLEEESARASTSLDRPSDWMVRREIREYAKARAIVVLSTFSARTFEDEGIPQTRLHLLTLGVDLAAFRARPEAIAARLARIRRGDPLTVLYVGSVSFQKGILDLARAITLVDPDRFRFVLAGKVLREARPIVRSLGARASVLGKLPQASLPGLYERADIFLFPTIQDGFPVVLAQARAAGLPIITTPHGAGEDVIDQGRDGWIVPIRDPEEIAGRLRWCDAHRDELGAMVAANLEGRSRDWSEVAAEFEAICRERTDRVTFEPALHAV